MRTLSSLALTLAAAAALAACGSMGMSTPMGSSSMGSPSMNANAMSMVVDLSAAQEVPPNASPATGRATVTLDRSTRMLTWSVAYNGLTGPATAAHIHNGAAGTNGPVVVPFAVTPSPITGSTTLTDAQVQQLAAGTWYVNIHTAANPGGEIRGQLR
jgi:hypothetical protein